MPLSIVELSQYVFTTLKAIDVERCVGQALDQLHQPQIKLLCDGKVVVDGDRSFLRQFVNCEGERLWKFIPVSILRDLPILGFAFSFVRSFLQNDRNFLLFLSFGFLDLNDLFGCLACVLDDFIDVCTCSRSCFTGRTSWDIFRR